MNKTRLQNLNSNQFTIEEHGGLTMICDSCGGVREAFEFSPRKLKNAMNRIQKCFIDKVIFIDLRD